MTLEGEIVVGLKRVAMPGIETPGKKRMRPFAGMEILPLKHEVEEDASYEEVNEIAEATFTLCLMKHAVVDKTSVTKLRKCIARIRASVKETVSNDDKHEVCSEDEWRRNIITLKRGGGPWVEGLMGECGLPFEKVLTSSDVDNVQARLSINKDNVAEHLLPLLRHDEDLDRGIPVTTYNVDGMGFPMIFKRWSQKYHVVTNGWNKFVKANNLKEPRQHSVSIQAFRHANTGGLCFLVSPIEN